MHTTPLHLERMARFRAAGLYLVTSGRLSAGRPTETIVSAAIEGGARWLIVEQDQTAGSAVQSAKVSIETLKKCGIGRR